MSLFAPRRPRLDIPAVGARGLRRDRRGRHGRRRARARAGGGRDRWRRRRGSRTTPPGHVIRELGTATVTREEILESWRNGGPARARIGEAEPSWTPRIESLPRDALLVAPGTERAAGRRVVFTNGCFDLLHAGPRRAARARPRRWGRSWWSGSTPTPPCGA